MRYIKFSGEVIRVPQSVTFWILSRGDEYATPYCVIMAPLDPQNGWGEPSEDNIIRSEGFKTFKEADKRLDQLLELLNK